MNCILLINKFQFCKGVQPHENCIFNYFMFNADSFCTYGDKANKRKETYYRPIPVIVYFDIFDCITDNLQNAWCLIQ